VRIVMAAPTMKMIDTAEDVGWWAPERVAARKEEEERAEKRQAKKRRKR
jgi:hypothetical protein